MEHTESVKPSGAVSLRLWPGVALVSLQWALRYGLPAVAPEATAIGVIGAVLLALLVLVWWVFFSRAARVERWLAPALVAVGLFVTLRFADASIVTGMMGFMLFICSAPLLSLAFIVWAVASRNWADGARRTTMAATILLACGAWLLVRSNGITSNADADLAWRWSETAEARMLAKMPSAPVAPTVAVSAPVAVAPSAPVAPAVMAEWPGFRGPRRDGVVGGAKVSSDWAAHAPEPLWKREVGPGWSSFAVSGDVFYTQEQRGEDEVVACYRVRTGAPVWVHKDAARFWESNAGAGPRGTPTLAGGRVYTMGATGIVNALDARTGAVIWKRNASEDTKAAVPGWGFSASPLVVGDLVVVAASGALIAYSAGSGEVRWLGPSGGSGYSSPHLATIDGVEQILFMNGSGVTGVAVADGRTLWEHAWPAGGRIVQPGLTSDGDVLVSGSDGMGMRRLTVRRGEGGWTVTQRWQTTGLKPYFNDFVVYQGHAYGFDGRILSCIDLADGARKWKGGRYGSGQMMLLAGQGMLLVLSEEGELALVAATPEGFREVGHATGISGKTWNHPVLAGDVLLVRNGQEMAAFRLAGGSDGPVCGVRRGGAVPAVGGGVLWPRGAGRGVAAIISGEVDALPD